MAFVVMMVLDDLGTCPGVMDAWSQAGIPGATILESTGLHRIHQMRDDLPLMPSVRDIMAQAEFPHRTVFAVVEDQATVDRLVEATRKVVDFDKPHSGLLFVLPVLSVYGLKRPPKDTAKG